MSLGYILVSVTKVDCLTETSLLCFENKKLNNDQHYSRNFCALLGSMCEVSKLSCIATSTTISDFSPFLGILLGHGIFVS